MKKCLILDLENPKLKIQRLLPQSLKNLSKIMTEIKSLIKLEVEKVVKKRKEEFHVTVLKFQEWINSTGV